MGKFMREKQLMRYVMFFFQVALSCNPIYIQQFLNVITKKIDTINKLHNLLNKNYMGTFGSWLGKLMLQFQPAPIAKDSKRHIFSVFVILN